MYDSTEQDLLRLLASRAGILPEYHDIAGTLHVTSDDTRRAILSAMGFQVASRELLTTELLAWDELPWQQACDPILILQQGYGPTQWAFRPMLEEGEEQDVSVAWTITDESGVNVHREASGPGLAPQEIRSSAGRRIVRFELPLVSDLPLGYYDVAVATTGSKVMTKGALRVVVAPPHCFVPEEMARGGRMWGLAVQLYSLRSETNWGVGDFTDLSRLVEWAGKELGAGIIGLNPLHALKNSRPYHLSPYSPTSRLFLNELYIDLDQLPEYHASADAQQLRNSAEFQKGLEQARTADLVDSESVVKAKRTMLDLAYRQFLTDNYSGTEPSLEPTTPRGGLLQRFIRDEGDSLEWFALFQVLEEERRVIELSPTLWPEWPPQYRSPDAPGLREFARGHRKRVRFFQYVQWVAADQLRAAKTRASQVQMTVGLYPDLALGSDRNGAEAWMLQDVLALGADCGAPPDAFAPQGQNWGFAPFHPLRLKSTGYRAFIELLRKTLQQGGAIRIDHVMALFRLFWVPRGMSAAAGAYVQYPAEDLLRILALESLRAQTLVIGEDLGTVPDYVREQLARYKVLSYRVFYFEREWDGACKSPSAYPDQSLAVVTTHDLPTLSGYWVGEDIRLRARLGMYANEQAVQQALHERTRDKGQILRALGGAGLLPAGVSDQPGAVSTMTPALCRAIHVYLASSPAWVVMANLDDVIGEVTQMNLPGTVDAYPNWSRKLSLSLEELQRDERVHSLAAAVRPLRPSAATF
ncbi:MAG: 4-alpha-glucanotransferase [Nitrospira sp.]|nr:4-alpha-glucanotransferase [Nitrospira sp.]MBP6605287.1 4-alpha-glucanotransferase [Nitrospira sp.]HQY56936.1 4-alpha-glucanotransferase [Nitrospira sp.]